MVIPQQLLLHQHKTTTTTPPTVTLHTYTKTKRNNSYKTSIQKTGLNLFFNWPDFQVGSRWWRSQKPRHSSSKRSHRWTTSFWHRSRSKWLWPRLLLRKKINIFLLMWPPDNYYFVKFKLKYLWKMWKFRYGFKAL